MNTIYQFKHLNCLIDCDSVSLCFLVVAPVYFVPSVPLYFASAPEPIPSVPEDNLAYKPSSPNGELKPLKLPDSQNVHATSSAVALTHTHPTTFPFNFTNQTGRATKQVSSHTVKNNRPTSPIYAPTVAPVYRLPSPAVSPSLHPDLNSHRVSHPEQFLPSTPLHTSPLVLRYQPGPNNFHNPTLMTSDYAKGSHAARAPEAYPVPPQLSAAEETDSYASVLSKPGQSVSSPSFVNTPVYGVTPVGQYQSVQGSTAQSSDALGNPSRPYLGLNHQHPNFAHNQSPSSITSLEIQLQTPLRVPPYHPPTYSSTEQPAPSSAPSSDTYAQTLSKDHSSHFMSSHGPSLYQSSTTFKSTPRVPPDQPQTYGSTQQEPTPATYQTPVPSLTLPLSPSSGSFQGSHGSKTYFSQASSPTHSQLASSPTYQTSAQIPTFQLPSSIYKLFPHVIHHSTTHIQAAPKSPSYQPHITSPINEIPTSTTFKPTSVAAYVPPTNTNYKFTISQSQQPLTTFQQVTSSLAQQPLAPVPTPQHSAPLVFTHSLPSGQTHQKPSQMYNPSPLQVLHSPIHPQPVAESQTYYPSVLTQTFQQVASSPAYQSAAKPIAPVATHHQALTSVYQPKSPQSFEQVVSTPIYRAVAPITAYRDVAATSPYKSASSTPYQEVPPSHVVAPSLTYKPSTQSANAPIYQTLSPTSSYQQTPAASKYPLGHLGQSHQNLLPTAPAQVYQAAKPTFQSSAPSTFHQREPSQPDKLLAYTQTYQILNSISAPSAPTYQSSATTSSTQPLNAPSSIAPLQQVATSYAIPTSGATSLQSEPHLYPYIPAGSSHLSSNSANLPIFSYEQSPAPYKDLITNGADISPSYLSNLKPPRWSKQAQFRPSFGPPVKP